MHAHSGSARARAAVAVANEEVPRSCRQSSSLNKEEAEALKREIATLSRKVNDMQKERDESKVVYIKKRGSVKQ